MWLVYILKSSNRNWYYVGSTNDVVRRLLEHNGGKVKSTKAYRPLVIVFEKQFKSETEAREYEHYLKKCRKAKESIIHSL